MRQVYENVELVRKAAGVTKTFIAGQLGLSLQGYRHIANGAVEMGAERLRVISDALNIEPSIFFDDELTENVIAKIERKEA